MSGKRIGGELKKDLEGKSPEVYTRDLHKEMESFADRIEKEMNIEKDAIEKDEEMLEELRRMLKIYARYEDDLVTFIEFIENQPDEQDNFTIMSRFRDAVDEGKLGISNNPTELPQVIQSIEEDFQDIFEKLKQKDEELKDVIEHDYEMEEEIEIIEKMAENLKKLTESFDSRRN
jgi:hypothetical protein